MRALLSIMALCLAACTAPYDKAEPDENNESESEVVEGIGPEVGEVDVSQPDLPKDTSAPEDTGDPVLATGFLENTDCGYDIGESACNFRLTDQNGNYWELDEHLGDLVLIDLSVMWCGPCKLSAETAKGDPMQNRQTFCHFVFLGGLRPFTMVKNIPVKCSLMETMI